MYPQEVFREFEIQKHVKAENKLKKKKWGHRRGSILRDGFSADLDKGRGPTVSSLSSPYWHKARTTQARTPSIE